MLFSNQRLQYHLLTLAEYETTNANMNMTEPVRKILSTSYLLQNKEIQQVSLSQQYWLPRDYVSLHYKKYWQSEHIINTTGDFTAHDASL